MNNVRELLNKQLQETYKDGHVSGFKDGVAMFLDFTKKVLEKYNKTSLSIDELETIASVLLEYKPQ